MTLPLKQRIIRDFDRAAKAYDNHATVQRKSANQLFYLIKDDINNNSVVLDAGCGTGYFHELLRKNKIYCPLFQTDIAYNMCEIANNYASPIEYGGTYTFACDIENLALPANAIDIAASNLTLQWTNVSDVLEQLHNSLRLNGKLAISTVGQNTFSELKQASSAFNKQPRTNDNFISEAALEKALTDAGFKNIKIHSDNIIIEHDNIKSLLTSIKGVGAKYKSKTSGNYLGRGYFKELEESYKNIFNGKLPASWHIIYAIADK